MSRIPVPLTDKIIETKIAAKNAGYRSKLKGRQRKISRQQLSSTLRQQENRNLKKNSRWHFEFQCVLHMRINRIAFGNLPLRLKRQYDCHRDLVAAGKCFSDVVWAHPVWGLPIGKGEGGLWSALNDYTHVKHAQKFTLSLTVFLQSSVFLLTKCWRKLLAIIFSLPDFHLVAAVSIGWRKFPLHLLPSGRVPLF